MIFLYKTICVDTLCIILQCFPVHLRNDNNDIFKQASETFVFMYMGMCLFTGEFTTWDWPFCVIAILACLLGRFVNTFGLSTCINACTQCKKKKNK